MAIYAGLVAVIAFGETTIVYPGTVRGATNEWFPAPTPGMQWDSLRVLSSDGKPVMLLTSRIVDSLAPWMIFLHGNGSLLGSSNCVDRYRLLNEAGFNVLAMEFRGMGLSTSTGPPNSRLLHEDALAAWNYLAKDRGVPAHRIAIYGWSLGGGVASALATAVHPAALVTEGTFTSLTDMGAEQYPWFPTRLIARNSFENLRNAEKLSAPWIVFHGRADRVVGFSHGEALARAARAGRLVPLNGDHMDAVRDDRATAYPELKALAERIRGH